MLVIPLPAGAANAQPQESQTTTDIVRQHQPHEQTDHGEPSRSALMTTGARRLAMISTPAALG